MADQSSSHAGNPNNRLTRRQILGSAATATTATLIPLTSCTTPVSAPAGQALPREAWLVLEAFVERLIPADANGPGAMAAGVPYYIDNTLRQWNSAELEFLSLGLLELTRAARRRYDRDFQLLSHTNQDALLEAMEKGEIDGFENAQAVFNRLHRLTLEGMFSDPYYGGNQNYIGWDLIGYPGAVMASTPDMQRMGGRLPPLHTSAYGSDYDGD
jgi:gluconate 2-dehydrogenase gamma chain